MSPQKPEEHDGGTVAGVSSGEASAETSGERTWMAELHATMGHLARMAVGEGADLDVFMTAARDAYLRASPELREYIERRNILEQMDDLRRKGMLPQA